MASSATSRNLNKFQEEWDTIQRQKQEEGLLKMLFSQEKICEDLSASAMSQHTDETWHEISNITMHLLGKWENKMQLFHKKIMLWLRQSFSALWLTSHAWSHCQTSESDLIWIWIQS